MEETNTGASPVAGAGSTLGFGAVFVISKQGDHGRKRAIGAALDGVGMKYAFLDATMGNELSPQQIAGVYDEQAALRHKTIPRRLHASHIGCNLSHRQAYQQVAARELKSALILEDDAMPLPGPLAQLAAAMDELPPDWDLLYLGTRGHRRAPWYFGLKLHLWLPVARLLFPRKYKLRFAEAARLYMRPYSAHLDRAGYHQGTHAYAVSRKGARILEANSLPITAPADATIGTLVLEGKLNAFTLRKLAFATTGAESQIVSALEG
ncbi:MAG TPA: glycosyltransferase family 25 protein [Flavobacteriales bacterium]|nr:glycosyltransferase family 25 protein [Flavobacteriales bacterium]